MIVNYSVNFSLFKRTIFDHPTIVLVWFRQSNRNNRNFWHSTLKTVYFRPSNRLVEWFWTFGDVYPT